MTTLSQSPLLGVGITVIAYVLGLALRKRIAWAHPLFICAGTLILFLTLANISYEDYRQGGDLIIFFLQPATVALGVPLYKHSHAIRRQWRGIVAAVLVGAVVGLASSAGIVWLLGGSRDLIISTMPKSVTAPIALELSQMLGGERELTAVLTVLTGLVGSMFGPWVLKRVGVRSDESIGAAIGTASHGIGTARIIRDSELQGAVGGVSMALCGIATAIFTIPLYYWLR